MQGMTCKKNPLLHAFPSFFRPRNNVFLALICACALASTRAFAQPNAPPESVVWLGSTTVDTGGGERGPWQQNDSRYIFVDDPGVALDVRGEAVLAWVDQASKSVLLQRFGSDGSARFGQAVQVSRSPEVFSWLPKVAIRPGASQQVAVLWQDIIFSGGSHGGDIMFARSQDGGASFSEPLNLSDSVSGAGKGRITRDNWHNGSYDLALDADGTVYAAWTEYEGRLMFARSEDGGVSFSSPRHIAGDDDNPVRGPALSIGAGDDIYLAWTFGANPRADIHIARSTDGGENFDRPQSVARTGSYSDAPKLAFGGDGVLHIAYAESGAGPFDRFRIHYTRSTDGARTFEAPREISTPVPEGAASAHFPYLALDGDGNPVVVWELHPQPRARPRGLGMAISRDGGRTFSAPVPVPGSADPAGGNNGSQQGLLMQKLAVNPDGLMAIANSSLREGEGSRVWLIRGRIADSGTDATGDARSGDQGSGVASN